MVKYEVFRDAKGNYAIQREDGKWLTIMKHIWDKFKPGYFNKREILTREELDEIPMFGESLFKNYQDIRGIPERSALKTYVDLSEDKYLDEISKRLTANTIKAQQKAENEAKKIQSNE